MILIISIYLRQRLTVKLLYRNLTVLESKESDTVTEVAAKRVFFLLAQSVR